MRRGSWASHAEGALSAHGGHKYARISFYQHDDTERTEKIFMNINGSIAFPCGQRPKGSWSFVFNIDQASRSFLLNTNYHKWSHKLS